MRGRGVRLGIAAAAALLTSSPAARSAEIADACVALAARTAMTEPYVLSFRRGPKRLTFVAARHTVDPDSDTFRAVEAALAAPGLKMVIVEGVATSRGANPRAFAAAPDARRVNEARYAARLARARSIPFVGGEPDEPREVRRLLNEGLAPAQVLGALVTRSVAALARVRPKDVAALAREARAAEIRHRRQSRRLARARFEFGGWYRRAYGVAPEADPRLLLRGTPCGDGPAAEVIRRLTRARNTHLWGLVRRAVESRDSVTVVYGGGHYLALADVLAETYGPPTVQSYAEPQRTQ